MSTFNGAPQIKGVFGVAPEHAPRFSLSRLEPIFEAAHECLEGVVFDSLDWAGVIGRYDTPGSLFYLDPPYFGGEADYGKDMFAREDFQAMAEQLREIKGAFVMSINDTPEIREWFDGFHIDEVRLNYTIAKSGGKKVQELIISNREVRTGLL
ncbi:DNA adenine methylase [Shimia sp. MIT910701]|uniref:DNA adenine methylase n=1 Tax=Shimia sp. MIT910701 TaxID=3096987 RepID=UPI003999CD5D